MTGLIDYSGHISARVPGGQSFFIHPQQLSRTEVKPGDMVEVTLKGEWVGGGSKPPSETPIHTAVYQVRQDVNCVIHLHPHYSILPSIVGQDLIPVCQHGTIFGAAVPVFPHAEHIETIEKGLSMAKVLGGSRALIMKGHGAVVAEASVEGAFLASCHLEENARLFVEASILGKPISLSEDQLKRAAADTFTTRSISKGWTYFLEKGRKAGIFWD
jgi:ribulose-5-phosphate 4-epimerase/fuculose-1-phosphate aldolase